MYEEQIEIIKSINKSEPKIAIVLGSGLGDFADNLFIENKIKYSKIPGLKTSTAPSHKGQFVFAKYKGIPIVLMQGRLHLYEGYSSEEVVMPIRLLKELGVNHIILTNAAGGINKAYNPGDFMLFEDHISLFVKSPLIGPNNDEIGLRFPDMSQPYNNDINTALLKYAYENNIRCHKGTYVQLTGPQFESPAEIKLLSKLGCDCVGMSTVIESIAAIHCGLNVTAISIVANLACGLSNQKLTSEEINEIANQNKDNFSKLIFEAIRIINEKY